MTSKHPPRLATWMLRRFGSGPDNEALIGDLTEQYVKKDSVMWFWRQAMKAIPISFAREIRSHKLVAARALLTGWGIWILCLLTLFPFLGSLYFGVGSGYSFGVMVPGVLAPFSPGQLLGTGWSLLWSPVLGQAAIPSGLEGQARAISYVIGVALPFLVWSMCGWLVAYRFRDQQTAVVLLLAGSNLFMALFLFGPYILMIGAVGIPLHIAPVAASTAASVMGILLGGGLFRDRLLYR